MAFSVAAQQVGDPGAQELLRQQERERVLREQQESRPDVRLESSQGEQGERLPTQEQPCVRIDRIVLDGEGAKDFQWALAAADPREDPASGRCLGTEGINVVMKRVQNAIIARGYVTTRVLSAPQDLNTGTLTLSVVPGRFREGTLHNESIIQAGDRLTFTSGGNTTLQGAQLLADQVVGRVTGDLTLRSEQDTDRYKTEQLAAKGEATIGYGFEGSASGSASMIDSDYRSVREQTGIAAGSGGFQLQVGGNTHLAGAVIGSTADPSKNQLSTGSLSFEELKNRAEFLSASVSGGTSGGGNPSDGFSFDPSLVPGLPTGDSKSSTTRSGLADGTVEIRSGDDSALAGLQRGVTGLDNANGFAPIFDERKVQERQELTQMLGAIGFEVIGNLAANKTAQANADLEVARANGDAEA
ncbi:POTRA domain-containing protein [Stenotrophomonas indicatrix]|uniref:POTRA domain-containing protein n=1 Tax=Stenotrophomonas indicatrix TaxID=2045451 RepID=UPI00320B084B